MAISRSDIPRELRGNRKMRKNTKTVKRATGGSVSKKNWIQGAIKNPGALRAKLGIAKGKTISKSQLDKAAKSRNPTTRRQANLAKTLKKMKRGRS